MSTLLTDLGHRVDKPTVETLSAVHALPARSWVARVYLAQSGTPIVCASVARPGTPIDPCWDIRRMLGHPPCAREDDTR
jgi:hypothetical protein